MAEYDIQKMIAELREAYNAKEPDLIVQTTTNRADYRRFTLDAAKPELIAGRSTTDNFTGMAFLPAAHAKDGIARIAVDLNSFDPSLYRDELTHEFSNFEAWRRGGSEFVRFRKKNHKYQERLVDEFKYRVTKQASPQERFQLREGIHPANGILALRSEVYGYPIFDSVISIPTDYVTTEKGFEQRLTARKLRKIQEWGSNRFDIQAKRIWVSGHLVYLAYNEFHPTNPDSERDLESRTGIFLQELSYVSVVTPVRRLRELFHTVNIPVDAANLLKTLVEAERIYHSFQAEKGPLDTRRYWSLFAESTIVAAKKA